MRTPADLQFDVPHPMPGLHHAPLLASYRLLLEQAEDAVRVQVRQPPSASPFEAWEVTRAALMARMAGTLRHVRAKAMPSMGEGRRREIAQVTGRPRHHVRLAQRRPEAAPASATAEQLWQLAHQKPEGDPTGIEAMPAVARTKLELLANR